MVDSTVNNGTVFHTHTLKNGLQIVGQPMPDFESVAISYYVRTGSRDEPDPSIAGVSHFLEHMVFKGTQTLDWQQITLEFNLAAPPPLCLVERSSKNRGRDSRRSPRIKSQNLSMGIGR